MHLDIQIVKMSKLAFCFSKMTYIALMGTLNPTHSLTYAAPTNISKFMQFTLH